MMLFAQKLHGSDVAASSFLQKSGAVAAEFACVVLHDGVGSVVSDDVVGSVA